MNSPATLPERAGIREWIAVAAGTIGSFMALLDISIVNAALPVIQGEIGASGTEGTWVATAYLVAEIIMIPLSAWLVQLMGLRNFLLVSAALFTGFSVVCGLASTLPMMIVGRVGQGFTGGALIPTAFTIIATRLPRSQQPIGTALFGITAVFGPILGPVVGGWITDNLSWHYAFFLNIPVCAVLIALLILGLPKDPFRMDLLRQADWLGILGLTIGLGCLTVMLEEGQREMWFESQMIVWLLIASVIGFALLLTGQKIAKAPVLKLRLLLDRSFGSVFLMSMVLGMVLYGVTYLIPQFLATIAGYSALQSGQVVFIAGFPAFVIMPLLPIAIKVLDVRLAMLMAWALLAVSCVMDWSLTSQSSGGEFYVSQFVRGTGQMMAMMFLNQAAISAVSVEDAGDASALFNTGRNLGGSIGLALMATLQDLRVFVHFNRITESVSANSGQVRLWMEQQSAALGSLSDAYRSLAAQYLEQAYVMAINDLYFALFIAVLATSPLALLLRPIRTDSDVVMH